MADRFTRWRNADFVQICFGRDMPVKEMNR